MKERWYSTITLNVTIKDAANVVKARQMVMEIKRAVVAGAKAQDGSSVQGCTATFSTEKPEPPVSAIHK